MYTLTTITNILVQIDLASLQYVVRVYTRTHTVTSMPGQVLVALALSSHVLVGANPSGTTTVWAEEESTGSFLL